MVAFLRSKNIYLYLFFSRNKTDALFLVKWISQLIYLLKAMQADQHREKDVIKSYNDCKSYKRIKLLNQDTPAVIFSLFSVLFAQQYAGHTIFYPRVQSSREMADCIYQILVDNNPETLHDAG